MVAGYLLPGRADSVDFGAGFGRGGGVKDEDLGVEALRRGLAAALPLAVGVEDGKAAGEAGRDLAVEEETPAGFGDALLGLVGGAEAEVELCLDPALRLGGVGGVAGESGRGCGRGWAHTRGASAEEHAEGGAGEQTLAHGLLVTFPPRRPARRRRIP